MSDDINEIKSDMKCNNQTQENNAKSIESLIKVMEKQKDEMTLEEQSQIGWNNMLKGRITKRMTLTQQKYYDDMNEERNELDKDLLPIKYSGECWASNLIRQLNYLALLHWQI